MAAAPAEASGAFRHVMSWMDPCQTHAELLHTQKFAVLASFRFWLSRDSSADRRLSQLFFLTSGRSRLA